MKIAYPNLLFACDIIDDRTMMCSVLTLAIGNNQGMGDVEYGKIYDVEYGKIYDIYSPPKHLRLFDGPSCNIIDMWRILGRDTNSGGLVVGTIIMPKLGLLPKPFGEACYSFWQGGDFTKNDEPQGNQVFCQMNESHPRMSACDVRQPPAIASRVTAAGRPSGSISQGRARAWQPTPVATWRRVRGGTSWAG